MNKIIMNKIILTLLLVIASLFLIAAKTATKKDGIDPEIQKYMKTFEEDFDKLSQQQLDVLHQVAERAYPFDMGYSAAAMAWQESNLGEWPVDIAGKSCGVFHKIIPNYMKDKKMTINSFKTNVVCADFMNDINLATSAYLDDMHYWKTSLQKRGYKGKELWDMMFRSYNAGYRLENKDGIRYSKQVQARIQVLQKKINFSKKWPDVKVAAR